MTPWKKELLQNFTNWAKLADYLQLSEEQRVQILPTSKFALSLPRRLAAKIEKGTLTDPILRQFLPLLDEEAASDGFTADPLEEKRAIKSARLLHKYEGRALVVTTSACAMHCRYCFRRHFNYAEGASEFAEELAILREDKSLSEVLLSGGDPLSLPNERLEALIRSLESIDHVKRLRFHTRFPIGIPERIDEAFLRLLSSTRLQVWFVIHCNHPSELDDSVLAALKEIQRLGIPVLNQAVLLCGVNDNQETLAKLFERLIDHGIAPYYLYQLDRVQGAAHFEVESSKGLALMEELRAVLPGYALPRFVQELPGAPSKVAVSHPLNGCEAKQV